MKIKQSLFKVALLAALSTVLAVSSHGFNQAQFVAAEKAIQGVPAPELPAKAGAFVAKVEKKERKDAAVAMTTAAVKKNRAAARLIVSAIVKVSPENAELIARTAARLVPEESMFITSAAQLAAPTAVVRYSRVAPPTEGSLNFLNNPINTNNRLTSDADNDGQNEGSNDNQPQNNFPNPNTNPPKPPPNPPAPAPNGYRTR